MCLNDVVTFVRKEVDIEGTYSCLQGLNGLKR